jgi:DNA polymerase-3 subunit epsilon
MRLLDAPLAIVDLETTGAHPLHDRITEIAVLEVAAGEVAAEWSTLVNPQTAIPPAIQALTGITNEMVADAPTFEQLAAGLHERLCGRVFVAHNARFDYGFLRQAFERSGLKFHARTLCTVKLSRRLYPQHARHNLDSVIARHGLECSARHRALGDAQAVWQFLQAAAEERGAEALAEAAQGIVRQPALPAHIERAMVDAVPEAPGVYLLYGEGAAPLYVGKSIAMRSRVMQHFSDDLRSAREQQLAREVRRIEWRRTCGELGALLKEAALVKDLAPAFNRMLRHARELCGFVLESGKLRLAQSEQIRGDTLTQLHGIFRSRRAALEALRGLADEHGLCLQTLAFEPARRGKGACFRHQLKRCAGVCAGLESPQAHHARLAAALARLKTLAWPWKGPIGVIEADAEREATEMQVLHNWCWLGTASTESEVAERLAGAGGALFDLDIYRILARHLGSGRARVLELPLAQG